MIEASLCACIAYLSIRIAMENRKLVKLLRTRGPDV
ncbi:hypothetical protein ABIA16_003583 [Sinorhizobium fredii]